MTTETAIAATFPFAALGVGLFIGHRLGTRACKTCAKMLAKMTELANDLATALRALDGFEIKTGALRWRNITLERERDILTAQMAELSKQLKAEQMNSKRLLAMRKQPPEPVTLLT